MSIRHKKYIYVLIAGLILLIAGISFSAAKNDTPAQTLEAGSYEAAVSRGLEYLRNNESKVSPLQWLMLDYLQRKFELDTYFSAATKTIKPPETEPDASDFRIHSRIAYPDKLVDSLPLDGASPMRQMMMAATHCDRIPLPQHFDELLRKNIEAGGYDLTHVAYSLERMQENGCPLPDKQDKQIREQVAGRIAALVTAPNTSPDLRYEAITFLMHMRRRDLVKPEWIDQIVAEQQSDGGWKVTKNAQASNDHATFLAVWGILEYSHSDARSEPVLRRIGNR
ncbi:MAG: hypothetical protein V4702_01115 [Patescibacteria group bacterium]